MSSKVELAKKLAAQNQQARQEKRITNLAKRKKHQSPSPSKSPKQARVSAKKDSGVKRPRTLVQDAILAAKRKSSPAARRPKVKQTPIQIALAKAKEQNRLTHVESPSRKAASRPKVKKTSPRKHTTTTKVRSPTRQRVTSPTRSNASGVTARTTQAMIDLSSEMSEDEKTFSDYLDEATYGIEAISDVSADEMSLEPERVVKQTTPVLTKKEESKPAGLSIKKRLRFVLVVMLMSCVTFLAAILVVDVIYGMKNIEVLNPEPKMLALPTSAHSMQVSELLESDNSKLRDWEPHSIENLRFMFSSLPKSQQNELLFKSVHELSLAVYEMEQTNRWLKYGVTFVGISTAFGWFLGPVVL